MNLWWIGALQDATRESVAGRWMVRSLQVAGYPVAAKSLPTGAPVEILADMAAYMNAAIELGNQLERQEVTWDVDETVLILSDSVLILLADSADRQLPAGAHRIGWWLRDVTAIAEPLREQLNRCAAIWTPYASHAEMLRHAGVTVPVLVTGMPFYPVYEDALTLPLRQISHQPEALPSGPRQRFFVEASYGGHQGLSLALQALWTQWAGRTDVAIYLKTYAGPRAEDAVGPLRDFRRAVKKWPHPIPPTYLWPWRLADPVYALLWAGMDVLVALDERHDGGTVLLEALHAGVPIIATATGAAQDIVTPEVGWPIPVINGQVDGATLQQALTEATDPTIWQAKQTGALAAAQTWKAARQIPRIKKALETLEELVMIR